MPEQEVMRSIEQAVKRVSASERRKKRIPPAIIAIVVIVAAAYLLLSLGPPPPPPPPIASCSNGVQDWGEEGIDCGGTCFAECLVQPTFGYTAPSSVYDVAVDSQDRIYVVDEGRDRVLVYSPELKYLKNIGERGVTAGGTGEMQFASPQSLAVSPTNGMVYVVDRLNHRLQVFDQMLNPVKTLNYDASGLEGVLKDLAFSADGKLAAVSNRTGKVYFIGENAVDQTFGTGFKAPEGIAFAPDGRLFVADSENCVVKVFGRDLKQTATIGSGKGSGNNQFNWPTGIALDSKGNVYVADSENKRIQIFNSDYSFKRSLPGFSKPVKLALDSKDRLIVADFGGNEVKVFDSSLNPAGKIEGIGWGQYSLVYFNPRYVATGSDGKIFLSSETNSRVVVLNKDFSFLKVIGEKQGSGNREFNSPRDLTVDSAGNLYVADKGNHRVQVFDPELNYIMSIGGGRGSGPGELNEPRSVAVDSSGRIFVTDLGNERVQAFDSQGNYLQSIESGAGYVFHEIVPITVDSEDNIYVANSKSPHVFQFNKELQYVKTIDVGDDVIEMEGGIAVDSKNRLVIVDIEGFFVRIIDLETGETVKTVGGHGAGPGEFNWPNGLAITPEGKILVVDQDNYRMQVFDSELNYLQTVDGGSDYGIETAE